MARRQTALRLQEQTIEMMDEICRQENIGSRAVLVDMLVRDYYLAGSLRQRIEALERRVEVIEGAVSIRTD